jgi:cyclopropane-fatty-acyl-phospholipid synthase
MSMSTQTALTPASSASPPPLAARRLMRLLERLPVGQLALRRPDGATLQFPSQPAGHGGPRATLELNDWAVFERTLKSGDIGFAESYIDGGWDTPDLTELLRLCILNREHIEGVIYGSWWGRLGYRLRHLLRRNS